MSSINFQTYGLKEAAWVAPRIVVGSVLETAGFRFPGSDPYPAQPEGSAFPFVRIRAQRALKGAGVRPGEELRIFSPMDWFHYTHAELIRGGHISYTEAHYSEALSPEAIKPGKDILVYLGEHPVPPGFPSGSVFQAFGEAYDRGDRAEEILAMLQEGPAGDFDRELRLQQGRRVRFPDGLEIVFLGHPPQRSEEERAERQWIQVGLAKDDYRGTLRLAHVLSADGKKTGESLRWHRHTVELIAIRDEPGIVVRKAE